MRKKGVFELPFSWLFAIVVGAVIIFLAIYLVSKLVENKKYEINTETSKKLSILFDPMELGVGSGKKPVPIKFSSETRIRNRCSLGNVFGKQTFSVSGKYGIGREWGEYSNPIPVENKYVFSKEVEEGKIFYYFSVPFNLPYKVSEVIVLTSDSYCFVDAPDFVKEFVNRSLQLENVYFDDCKAGSKKVCFSGGSCETLVSGSCSNCNNRFEYGSVSKKGEIVYYKGDLLYAAIFSAPEQYECNVKRIAARTSQLAYLYEKESQFLESEGCGPGMSLDLLSFANQLNDLEDSQGLLSIYNQAEKLDIKNSALECSIW